MLWIFKTPSDSSGVLRALQGSLGFFRIPQDPSGFLPQGSLCFFLLDPSGFIRVPQGPSGARAPSGVARVALNFARCLKVPHDSSRLHGVP